jgi:polar amino acid transport system substrate-binding protein
MGVKVELVPVTSANRIPYLQTRKTDLVISTLGKNAEREKVIDFTSAYSPFFQAIFDARSQRSTPNWSAKCWRWWSLWRKRA